MKKDCDDSFSILPDASGRIFWLFCGTAKQTELEKEVPETLIAVRAQRIHFVERKMIPLYALAPMLSEPAPHQQRRNRIGGELAGGASLVPPWLPDFPQFAARCQSVIHSHSLLHEWIRIVEFRYAIPQSVL